MKRVVKYGLIGLGGLALLWGGLALTVWVAFPPEKVKSLVLEKAGAALHRRVELESAQVRVFPFLGVSLKGLSVANNPDSGFSAEPLASLQSLDVRISLTSLLKFSPVVETIVLEKPAIRLEVLADGRTGLDGLGGPKDTSKVKSDTVKPLTLPFPLTVRRISIVGGSLAYIDRKANRQVVAGDISETVSLSTDKTLENVQSQGTLFIKDLSVYGKGFPVRKGGIRLEVEHDISLNLPAASVEIRKLRASLQDMGVTITGKASNILVAPSVDLKISTDEPLELGRLLAEIPKEVSPELSKLTLAGQVELSLTAKGIVGPTTMPEVDGVIHARSISASVQGLPAKLSNLGSRVVIHHSRTVEIDSTQWVLDGAPGSLRLAVDSLPVPPHKSVPYLRELLAVGKVDLGSFAQVLAPLVPSLDTLKPTGLLSWSVTGKGPLDPKNPTALQIKGTAELSKVSAKVAGLPDRPVIDGSATLANTSAGAKLAIVMGPTDLSVDAKVADWLALVMPKLAEGKTTSVTVATKSRKIDLDRLLPPPDTAKKPESAPLTELPLLPPVVLYATFQADRIQALGLSITGVTGKAGLQKGQLAQSMAGSIASGRISQNLSADLVDRKAPSIRLVADLSGVQIHEVLVGLKDRIPPGAAKTLYDKVYGKGGGHLQASVKAPIAEMGKKLTADLSGALADGKIVNFPAVAALTSKASGLFPSIPDTKELAFKTLTIQAQLVDGKVLIKDLQMDGSNLGLVQANGTVGVDQSLDMRVDTHLPAGASSLMQSGAGSALSSLGLPGGSPLPQDAQKRVVLSWNVKGTVADPSVSPDLPRISSLAKGVASALASEAKARAEKEAKDQADKLKAQAATAAKQAVQGQAKDATQTIKGAAQNALKGIKKPW